MAWTGDITQISGDLGLTFLEICNEVNDFGRLNGLPMLEGYRKQDESGEPDPPKVFGRWCLYGAFSRNLDLLSEY